MLSNVTVRFKDGSAVEYCDVVSHRYDKDSGMFKIMCETSGGKLTNFVSMDSILSVTATPVSETQQEEALSLSITEDAILDSQYCSKTWILPPSSAKIIGDCASRLGSLSDLTVNFRNTFLSYVNIFTLKSVVRDLNVVIDSISIAD